MAKAVKLSDIAAKIGVSTVTVSKALSGQKGMSDELRERIVALADEMGYVKRVQNKEKETGRSFNLGVIVAERYIVEKQSFYWNIYQEISQRAIKKRCFTMIEIVEYAAENGCVMPILLSENKVDGIIVMGAFGKKYMKAVERWTKDFPVLYFDTTIGDEAGDYIVSNNLYGGYNMTNYLLDRGHKKIGFVGTRLMIPSIDDRFFGYLKALMERGIEYRKDWIIDDRDNVYGKMDYDRQFILPKEVPTAFFCNCDKAASLIIRKLEEAWYSVPNDVSVVGFDNFEYDQEADIGITTYEINIGEMATRAVHIMIHKMQNASYSAGVFSIQGKIIERDSVKTIDGSIPYAD